MAKSGCGKGAVVAGAVRRGRASLLLTTALQAAVLSVIALPVHAQTTPAANTLPTGGTVRSGSASITQSGASMTVTQTTQNAGIDRNSFNVGAAAKVTF